MGYILPITPYSYGNYQNRIIKKHHSPYRIGRKPSVHFQKVLREVGSDTTLREEQQLKKKRQHHRNHFYRNMKRHTERQVNIQI